MGFGLKCLTKQLTAEYLNSYKNPETAIKSVHIKKYVTRPKTLRDVLYSNWSECSDMNELNVGSDKVTEVKNDNSVEWHQLFIPLFIKHRIENLKTIPCITFNVSKEINSQYFWKKWLVY